MAPPPSPPITSVGKVKGLHQVTVSASRQALMLRFLLDRQAAIRTELRRPVTAVRERRQMEPMRRKSHWDFLLEEMVRGSACGTSLSPLSLIFCDWSLPFVQMTTACWSFIWLWSGLVV